MSLADVGAALALDRQALIDTAAQHGIFRQAAEDFINTLGLTPKNINTSAVLQTHDAELALATKPSSPA